METVKFNIMDGLTYNNIIDTMKEMVHREKCKSFPSFNNNEYCWEIGFEVLRRLRGINPNFRNSSEIGGILDIKVRRILHHPDDTSKICLIRDRADDRQLEYCAKMHPNDLKRQLNSIYGLSSYKPEIINVIFNDPATIVFWSDGKKTVVKAEGEPFDPEKGLAMAIVKKFFGTNKSKSNYNDIFKKWIPEEDKDDKKLEEECDNTEILTAKQLAEKTGSSVSTVLRDCRRGLHPGAIKVDGKWLIPYSGLVKDDKNEID